MRRGTRRARGARPALEGLEERRLLHARVAGPQVAYTTPDGTQVGINLIGPGTLAGTTVRPDGSLDLVFNNTTSASLIYGRVSGGSGRAPLASVRDADAAPGDFSGVGDEPVGLVKLQNFDLIPGGQINLSGGARRLDLGSAAANSQVHLTQLPTSSTSSSTTTTSTVPGTGVSGGTTTAGTTPTTLTSSSNPSGVGGLGGAGSIGGTSTGGIGVGGSSGGSTGGSSGGTNSTVGVGNTGGFTTTGTTTTGSTTTGTATTGTTVTAGTTSTAVAGTTSGSTASTTTSSSARIPGPDVVIHSVSGAPHAGPMLGDPQIFGYDPTANTLIRFDARTGAVLQTIPLPGTGTAVAGVALGRDGGRLVALVGYATTIFAFDASTGAPVGRFSTASLAANGLNTIDGIGSTSTRTVVSDASAGTLGLAQEIDVTASLASGQAVAVGKPFAPQREFELSGGLTGLAGTDAIYSAGAAHFDTFQPDLTQDGFLVLSAASPTGTLAEIGRFAEPGTASAVNAGPPGTARSNPTQALGSVEQDIALVTGVANGGNTVSLFSPAQSFAADGTVTLADPNRLAGLSESFHPELAGSVLVDVVGALRSFTANSATGLVLNVSGHVFEAHFGSVSDSTIAARPFGHLYLQRRSNLTILSTPRFAGTLDGVTIVPNLKPIGPLVLP